MKTISFLLLLILIPAVALPQSGQQKKKTTATQSAQKAGARVAEKQTEKARETMQAILVGYQGSSTNLGRLAKVGQDFVVFEKDNTALFVAISAIVSVQEVPPDEEDEMPEKTLKIRLAAID